MWLYSYSSIHTCMPLSTYIPIPTMYLSPIIVRSSRYRHVLHRRRSLTSPANLLYDVCMYCMYPRYLLFLAYALGTLFVIYRTPSAFLSDLIISYRYSMLHDSYITPSTSFMPRATFCLEHLTYQLTNQPYLYLGK